MMIGYKTRKESVTQVFPYEIEFYRIPSKNTNTDFRSPNWARASEGVYWPLEKLPNDGLTFKAGYWAFSIPPKIMYFVLYNLPYLTRIRFKGANLLKTRLHFINAQALKAITLLANTTSKLSAVVGTWSEPVSRLLTGLPLGRTRRCTATTFIQVVTSNAKLQTKNSFTSK